MSQHQIVSSALASLLALGLGSSLSAHAADGAGKEKCYGIVKTAGSNDCANLSGSHSCAGQATAVDSPMEWKYVAKGSCKAMNGMSAEEAKAAKKS